MNSEISLYVQCDRQEAQRRITRALNVIAVYWFLPPGARPLLIRFYRDHFKVYKRRYESRLLLGPTVFHGEFHVIPSGIVVSGRFSVTRLFRLLFSVWIVSAWIILAGSIWLFLEGYFSSQLYTLLILSLSLLFLGFSALLVHRRRAAKEKKFVLRFLEWALQARLISMGDEGYEFLEQGEVSLAAVGKDSRTAIL